MKTRWTLANLLVLFLFLQTQIAQSQNCFPADLCGKAPILCLNDLVVNIDGTDPQGITDSRNCAGDKDTRHQKFIAFKPAQPTLEIRVDNQGQSPTDNIEASIFDNCNQLPVSCSSGSKSVTVGKGVTFVPGQTYFLMVSGPTGLASKFVVNCIPQNAIITPPDPITPKWPPTGLLEGPEKLGCSGLEAFYTVPKVACATGYIWTIDAGDAQIIATEGDEVVDMNPGSPGLYLSISGPNSNKVRLLTKATGTSKLCVHAIGHCDNSSGITCKIINTSRPPDLFKSVRICPQDSFYYDPTLPDGPFCAGFPCPIAEIYDIPQKNADGCAYTLKLSVAQYCENQIPTGANCACTNGAKNVLDPTPLVYCTKNLTTFGTLHIDTTTNPSLRKNYVLTTSYLTPGLENVLDVNNTGVFAYKSTYENNKPYYISEVQGLNLDSTAIGRKVFPKCINLATTQVQFIKPVAASSSPSASVCGRSFVLKAEAKDGTGKWKVQNFPTGATFAFVPSENDPNATFQVNSKGLYTLNWIVSNGVCSDTSVTKVNFLDKPTAVNLTQKCNQSGTSYTVSFKLAGVPPFKLLKGSSTGFLTGSIFSSLPVQNAKPYKFLFKDAVSCDTLVVSGTYTCSSLTDDTETNDRSGEPDLTIPFSYQLSPNPANNELRIQLSAPIAGEIVILDLNGALVKRLTLNGSQDTDTIDISTLSAGPYTCQIKSKSGVYNQKFLVQR